MVLFSCEDDEVSINLIDNAQLTAQFADDTLKYTFVNDDLSSITLKSSINLDFNVTTPTTFTVQVNEATTLTEDIFSLPENEFELSTGQMNTEITLQIDGSKLTVENGGKVILDLTSADCQLGETKQLVVEVERKIILVPEIVVVPLDVTVTRSDAWLLIDLADGGTMGLWHRNTGADEPSWVALELYGRMFAGTQDGKDLRLTKFNEGDLIDENTAWVSDYYAAWDYIAHFCAPDFDLWLGQTGYLAFKMTVNNVEVNCWMKATVSADGKTVKLAEYAYEKKGWAIEAGQRE